MLLTLSMSRAYSCSLLPPTRHLPAIYLPPTCHLPAQPADIYLIDEPSAYLDSEQRILASKVIKRFIMHSKKTAFIVEHDFIMATYLADR